MLGSCARFGCSQCVTLVSAWSSLFRCLTLAGNWQRNVAFWEDEPRNGVVFNREQRPVLFWRVLECRRPIICAYGLENVDRDLADLMNRLEGRGELQVKLA